MKKIVLLLLCFVVSASVVFSQNPQRGFSFQGIARDLNGKALGTSSIDVQISVIQTSFTYTEVQTVQTDAFGVFSLIIGSVTPVEFAKLDFSKDSKLKVEVKVNGAYSLLSQTDLLSVPYSKAADYATNSGNAQTAAYAQSAFFPAGVMMAFAGPKTKIPAGWLLCDGTPVSRTTYADLFNAIGTSWGSGDNTTTFNLPSTQGQFLRGVSDGSGLDPDAANRTATRTGGNTGDNVGSIEADMLRSHTHTENYWDVHSASLGGNEQDQAGGVENRAFNKLTDSGTTGGSETRPKNVNVYYIIKY
jgi:microcystin-dependent protein